jgi:chromate reductase
MHIDVFELDDIPLYNADLDTDELRPHEVRRLKDGITAAEALLMTTPEYNHSVPGVLQNAIDWASRPALKSPLVGKPVAIAGASPSAVGTARAQQQLKLVLMSTLALVLPHPGVLIAQAHEKFDAVRLRSRGETVLPTAAASTRAPDPAAPRRW